MKGFTENILGVIIGAMAGAIILLLLYTIKLEQENKFLNKVGKMKDSVNTHNQKELVRLEKDPYYQWVKAYGDSIGVIKHIP